VWNARVDLADSPAVVTARVTTALGRAAERSILLNGRGLQASLDAHVVEQMVAVVRNGEPVEGLKAADFTVRDDRGTCEIREVRLVRDVTGRPLGSSSRRASWLSTRTPFRGRFSTRPSSTPFISSKAEKALRRGDAHPDAREGREREQNRERAREARGAASEPCRP
jgi:hypothetical protein